LSDFEEQGSRGAEVEAGVVVVEVVDDSSVKNWRERSIRY
jgi:hypothetical protein